MQIIAISGHAQNGKDTVAHMIEERLTAGGARVLITHYADLVKYICRSFFHWNGEKDEYGRSLLQHVGTDIVRKQRPDYWVDFLIDMFRFFGKNWDVVLIPDARFPNEIDRLREAGFNVEHLRILRNPGFSNALTEEQRQHASETSLDAMLYDHIIYNIGTLHDLETQVEQYIKENGYGKE